MKNNDINLLYVSTINNYNYSTSFVVPLAGGCSLDEDLTIDANLLVLDSTDDIYVGFQWSRILNGSEFNPKNKSSCENKDNQELLEYEIYLKHLSFIDIFFDGYFDVLKEMITAEKIITNGFKVC